MSSANNQGSSTSSKPEAKEPVQDQKSQTSKDTQKASSSTTMPADTHTLARRLSAWDAASSSTDSSLHKGNEGQSSRKSSISKAIGKAKAKLSNKGSEMLADDEEEFEKQKAKEQKKAERKADYERLGLDDRVKFGTMGARGFNSM